MGFLEQISAELTGPSRFKSLYIAMVQSSGSGKTRFAFELQKLLDARVAYLCLRPKGSTGARDQYLLEMIRIIA